MERIMKERKLEEWKGGKEIKRIMRERKLVGWKGGKEIERRKEKVRGMYRGKKFNIIDYRSKYLSVNKRNARESF